jgi:fibronectin type 3 domain-containing protein
VFSGYNGPAIDPTLMSNAIGTNPINYLQNLTPGNYDVTLLLGDSTSSGSTSVQAEAKRAMLGTVNTSPGTYETRTFTVNVREPEGQPTGGSNGEGTPGLNFLFSGSEPKLSGIGVAPAQNSGMIYLAGDSTVSDWLSNPYAGWGQMLPQYFKLGTAIANYADPGESTSSFLSKPALFATMIALVKANDYVFIQFGHNDKTATKEDYQANLTKMITEIKNKGAVPILVTPVVRRLFNSDNLTLSPLGLLINDVGVDLPAAMKEVALANNVQLIDLSTKSKELVESLGVEGSKSIYLTNELGDNTHFSRYGANEMAKLVLQGMKELKLPQVANLRVSTRPSSFFYDMGNGPVAEGYTQVTASTLFNTTTGYGLTGSGLDQRNRNTADPLKTDFVFSKNTFTFSKTLNNGMYEVRVLVGDAIAAQSGNMTIKAEGQTKVQNLTTTTGEFKEEVFLATVADGQLDVEFSATGTDTTARVNAVQITPTQFFYDMGDGPVASGYEQVTTTTLFADTNDYGLTGYGLDQRNRNYSDPLKRDFVFSKSPFGFSKIVRNGTYEVQVLVGDAIAAQSGSMTVKAEDQTKVQNLTTASGVFKEETFNVTVTDGKLDLEFSASGTDTTARLNALKITLIP